MVDITFLLESPPLLKVKMKSLKQIAESLCSPQCSLPALQVSLIFSPLKLLFSPSSFSLLLFNFFCKHMKINWASLSTFSGTLSLARSLPLSGMPLIIFSLVLPLPLYIIQPESLCRACPLLDCRQSAFHKLIKKLLKADDFL